MFSALRRKADGHSPVGRGLVIGVRRRPAAGRDVAKDGALRSVRLHCWDGSHHSPHATVRHGVDQSARPPVHACRSVCSPTVVVHGLPSPFVDAVGPVPAVPGTVSSVYPRKPNHTRAFLILLSWRAETSVVLFACMMNRRS